MRSNYVSAIAALGIGACIAQANATVIDGILNFGGGGANYYDPIRGFVPAGAGNHGGPSITVPSFFAFADPADLLTATFTSTSLTIEDIVLVEQTFSNQFFTADTPGFFSNLKLQSNSFPGEFVYSLTGDTLSVNWIGSSVPVDATAVFSFGSPVPEASTWAMMALGFAGLSLIALRARGSRASASA